VLNVFETINGHKAYNEALADGIMAQVDSLPLR
jgi:hypothetical protein